jgi:hypothetical protein
MKISLILFQEGMIHPIDDFYPIAVQDTRIPLTKQAGTHRFLKSRSEPMGSA